jgi:two-component system cell cycle response regulator
MTSCRSQTSARPLIRSGSDIGIEALITSAELNYISGVELCWETRLIATSSRPIYVLMMSS